MAVESTSFFGEFISAIPSAAISPLALVAYLGTLATWAYVSTNERRLQLLLERIEAFPEQQRRDTVVDVLKAHIPPDFSAKQYVELVKDRNKLWRYLAVVASVVIIASMALWKAYDSRTRTDNFIKEVLDTPTSDYMSALNVLGNGPSMVQEAAKDIRFVSDDEMRQIVDRLALQRMNAEQIARHLGELSGSQRLQKVSGSLGNAAKRLDTAYKKLADCFRAVECRPSSQTERLCKTLQGIIVTLNASNAEARKIKGVTVNETDSSPMLGNGTMDLYFVKVTAPNVTYINSQVCGQS